MACEDYPCCGHGTNQWGQPDCPTRTRSGREVWRCVECGKPLKKDATSSICDSCMRAARRRMQETGEMWPND